ncbi:MAG: MoaD/ThiS family protein [Sphingomicrobium sp.]
MVQVRFYGRLAEQIAPQTDVAVPKGATVGELRSLIASRHPQLALDLASPLVRVCIGDTLVADDFPIDQREPVEFFAPVSGG